MKKLLFTLLTIVVLLSSCDSKCDAKYRIVGTDGYIYYTDSYTITQTNCIVFTGKSGFTDGREVSLCGPYVIVNNHEKL